MQDVRKISPTNGREEIDDFKIFFNDIFLLFQYYWV